MNKKVIDLLFELKDLNIEIELADDSNIRYKSPKGGIDEKTIFALKENKKEIIQYLREVEKIFSWEIDEDDNIKKALVTVTPREITNNENSKYNFVDAIKNEYENENTMLDDINLWLDLANEIAGLSILNMFQNMGVFAKHKKYTFEEIKEKSKPKKDIILIKFLDVLLKNKLIVKNEESFMLEENAISKTELCSKWYEFKVVDKRNNNENVFYEYYKKSVENLIKLFRGEINPIQLLFPNGDTIIAKSIYGNNSLIKLSNRFIGDFVDELSSREKTDKFKIIELGAGVGGTTRYILNKINRRRYEYHFTDISNFFLNEFKNENRYNEKISYSIFDINKEWEEQIDADEKFDLVICSNVLHNAINIEDVVNKIRFLLKKDGAFIILEQTKDYDYLHASLELNMESDKILDYRRKKGNVLMSQEEWEEIFTRGNINLIAKFPETESLKKMGTTVFIGQFNNEYDTNNEFIKTYFKVHYNLDNVVISEIKKDKHIEKQDKMSNKGGLAVVNREKESDYSILKGIWSKVLGIEINDINENSEFYSLGGDSLALTKLISEIWNGIPKTKKWKWNDFMKIVGNNFTFSELSFQIDSIEEKNEISKKDEHIKKNSKSKFISYENGKEKDIYILFHDGTGGLNKYRNLIDLFYQEGIENRLYGIEYNEEGIEKGDLHKVLSTKYAKNIYVEFREYRNIKFIGYCVGGSIAFETAYILKKTYDKKIKDVIIIDSYLNAELIISNNKNTYIEKCMKSDYIMALLFTEILGKELPISLDKKIIQRYIDDENKYNLGEAIKGLEKLNLFEEKYNGVEFKKIFYIMKKYFLAVSIHIPNKYDGKVTIVHGLDQTKNNFLESEKDFDSSIDVWKYFLGSEFRYYTLKYDHFSILTNGKKLMNIIKGNTDGEN